MLMMMIGDDDDEDDDDDDIYTIRLAVEGMQQENYNIVFPTPFSKVC